ncbi:Crp/Fnr family transcriptional regulator [Bacteriovoracaceae bacterium]|nr:Crp/Fnr family transcriptional regulator [Bacteriovoracaceae bacterium]
MKYTELYEFFNNIQHIPVLEWEHLISCTHEKNIRKGELILRAGDAADSFNLIISGFMRMFYIDPKGREYTKSFRNKFDVASPYAEMLQSIPSRIYIDALEDSKVLSLKYTEFVKLYDRHECWNTIGRKFAEKYFILKEHREYEFLLLTAKERYDCFCKDYADIIDKIPQYQIASFLGITPVSLSRILKDKP